MRLTTRLPSAAALTGALALGAAPAATAATALDGYSKTIPEKAGDTADEKADGGTKGEMDRPDEKLSGLPLTAYVVCSL